MKKDSFDEVENVASATECTGILPAFPDEETDADEHAARLYAIHAPKRRKEVHCAKG